MRHAADCVESRRRLALICANYILVPLLFTQNGRAASYSLIILDDVHKNTSPVVWALYSIAANKNAMLREYTLQQLLIQPIFPLQALFIVRIAYKVCA